MNIYFSMDAPHIQALRLTIMRIIKYLYVCMCVPYYG